MATKDAELEGDIHFIKTPSAEPSAFETGVDCGIPLTNVSFLSCAHSSNSLNWTLLISIRGRSYS